MPTVTTPPAHVVLGVGVAAISSPLGSVSTSGADRTAGVLLPLLKVMVSVEISAAPIVDGLKALPSVGKTAAGVVTLNVAIAGPALLPLLVCSAPAANELM